MAHSGIVRKGVEGYPRNMEMDPVDGAWISNTRIRLEVAHGDSAYGPCPRLCVLRIIAVQIRVTGFCGHEWREKRLSRC